MKKKNRFFLLFLVLCIFSPLLAQQEASKILITKIDGDNQYKEDKYITVDGNRIHVQESFYDNQEVDFGDVKYIHAKNVGKGTKELPYSADDFRNRRGNVFLDFFRNIYKKTKVVIKGGQSEKNVSMLLSPDFNFKNIKRIAIVIANYRYDDGGNLDHTFENKLKIQQRLEDLGWGVFPLENMRKEELEEVLKDIDTEINKETREAVLIYYVGHGVKHNAEYIKCIDGLFTNFVKIIKERNLNNGVCAFVYDACRLAPTIPIDNNCKALGKPTENKIVLFSTGEDQPAIDDMEFTNAFVNNIGMGKRIYNEFDNIKKKFESINRNLKDYPGRDNRQEIDIIIPERYKGTILSKFKFKDYRDNTKSIFFVGAGGILNKGIAGPYISLGYLYKRWRFELGGACNIKSSYSDDIFIYDSEKRLVNGYKYKGDFRFFGNVGYDIPINKNLDFVPLLGVSLNRIRGEKLTDSSSNIGEYATAVSGTIDARVIWSPWKSRTIQFQGSFDFYGSPKFLKSENYKSFEDYDNSNTIKMWATGFDFQIGVIWNVTK